MHIDLNAPLPGWFFGFLVALLFALLAGLWVADRVTNRVRDYRGGRLTDLSLWASMPRPDDLTGVTDDGCLGLGIFWLCCSLAVWYRFSHLSYWAALAMGLPATLLISGVLWLSGRVVVCALTLLILRLGGWRRP